MPGQKQGEMVDSTRLYQVPFNFTRASSNCSLALRLSTRLHFPPYLHLAPDLPCPR